MRRRGRSEKEVNSLCFERCIECFLLLVSVAVSPAAFKANPLAQPEKKKKKEENGKGHRVHVLLSLQLLLLLRNDGRHHHNYYYYDYCSQLSLSMMFSEFWNGTVSTRQVWRESPATWRVIKNEKQRNLERGSSFVPLWNERPWPGPRTKASLWTYREGWVYLNRWLNNFYAPAILHNDCELFSKPLRMRIDGRTQNDVVLSLKVYEFNRSYCGMLQSIEICEWTLG